MIWGKAASHLPLCFEFFILVLFYVHFHISKARRHFIHGYLSKSTECFLSRNVSGRSFDFSLGCSTPLCVGAVMDCRPAPGAKFELGLTPAPACDPHGVADGWMYLVRNPQIKAYSASEGLLEEKELKRCCWLLHSHPPLPAVDLAVIQQSKCAPAIKVKGVEGATVHIFNSIANERDLGIDSLESQQDLWFLFLLNTVGCQLWLARELVGKYFWSLLAGFLWKL